MRGCARSKLLSRRLVVGRGRSLPSASGRGRSLPSASGRGRSLPSVSGCGRSLPSASGWGRSLPSASLCGRSLLKRFAYFPQLLPQQCYNFPSSATTSQAVLQLPLRWHCLSKPLIVCLIITDSSTAVLSTAFVVTVFPLML